MEHFSQAPGRTGSWLGGGGGATNGNIWLRSRICPATPAAHRTPKQQQSRLASGPSHSHRVFWVILSALT